MLKRLFQSKKYQPQARWGHSSISVGTKAILWGGMQATLPEEHQSAKKTRYTSVVEVFDLHTAKWIQERTVGNPPLGIRGQACAAVGSDMYFFGGFCGHDWCRHNSVYCLDTLINVWREVIPINPAMNPMKKSRCGMFHFRMEGVDYLCVVGGTGLLCSANQTDATYIPWRENPDWGWTDEHHILALNNGTWIVPSMTGDIAPPCAGFSLTKISENSAVFYGGYQPQNGSCMTDVYTVTVIDTNRVHWKKMEMIPEPGRSNDRSFPVGRQDHAIVCLSSSLTGHSRTLLLMLGGRNQGGNTLNDCWILDVEKRMWTQVFLLESIAHRHFHSTVSFSLTPQSVLVILFGGVREWLWGKPARQQPALTGTVLLEATATPNGEWRLRVLMGEGDTTPVDDYYQIVQQLTINEDEEEREDELEETETASGQDELDTSVNPLQPCTSTRSQKGTVVYDIPTPTTKGITQERIPPTLSSRASNDSSNSSSTNLQPTEGDLQMNITSRTGEAASKTIRELHRQLIIAHGRANEIEEVLHGEIMSAENRAVKNEEKCRVAEGKVIVLEGQVKTLEQIMKKSKDNLCESDGYSEQVTVLEWHLLDSENRAIAAEIALNEMEIQLEGHKKKLERAQEIGIEKDQAIEALEQQVVKMNEKISVTEMHHTPYWKAMIDLQHQPSIALSFIEEGSQHHLLTITVAETIFKDTLQTALDSKVNLSQQDIISISYDVTLALAHLYQTHTREYFVISLDPTSVLLQPREDTCNKRHAQLLVSLPNDTLSQPLQTGDANCSNTSFHNDLKRFSSLLIAMATGASTCANIEENIGSIQWPDLVSIINLCLNTEENKVTIDEILRQFKLIVDSTELEEMDITIIKYSV